MKNKLKYILIGLITLFVIIAITYKTGLLNKVSFALEDNPSIQEEGNIEDTNNNDNTIQNNTEENNIENNDTNETNNANNIDNNTQNNEENNTNDINNEPSRDGENTNNSSSVEIRKLEAKIVEVTADSGATSVVGEDGYHVVTLKNKSYRSRLSIKTKVVFALSGEGPYDPGTVKITIPKSIVKNQVTGDMIENSIVFSIPQKYSNTTCNSNSLSDYHYYYDSSIQKYIITNCRSLPGGAEATFEFIYKDLADGCFSSTQNCYSSIIYKDMELQAPFQTELFVNYKDNIFTSTSADYYRINTTVSLKSISKGKPIVYYEWLDEWGAKPSDANDYYYLSWPFNIQTDYNRTQGYNLVLFEDFPMGDSLFVSYVFGNINAIKPFSSDQEATINNILFVDGGYGNIITRIKKSSVGVPGVKTLNNNLVIKLEPIDGVDEATQQTTSANYSITFVEDFNYTNFPSSFSYDKSNGGIAHIMNYNPNTFSLSKNEFNFNHYFDIRNPEKTYDSFSNDIHKNPIQISFVDEELYINNDSDRINSKAVLLDESSYDFLDIDITYGKERYFYVYNTATRSLELKSEKNTSDSFYYYGKWNGEWKIIGHTKYNESTDTYIFDLLDTSLAEFVNNHLLLSENCKGVKMLVDTTYIYRNISLSTKVRLNSSDQVKNILEGNRSYFINKGNVKLSQYNIEYKNFSDYDDHMIEPYKVYEQTEKIKKIGSNGIDNNLQGRVVTIPYRITINNNIYSNDPVVPDEFEAYESFKHNIQKEGTFYDLLPKGTVFKSLNGLYIGRNSNVLVPKSNYSYKILSNYKNTGRDLLVIYFYSLDNNFYFSPNNYSYGSSISVDYTISYPWDSIYDYGNVIYNDFIYESGTSLYKGKKNDGSDDLGIQNQEIYKNIGTRSSEPVYLTGSVTTTLNYPTSAELGLYKRVKGTYDTGYSNEGYTNIGETYSYKLHFGSSTNTDTSNMILFDSLENYNEEGVTDNRWRGTFDDIDISQPKMKGINPIVYYSEIENLNLEENNDLSIGAVWKRYTNLTDKTKVKAIAVDMRKASDGSNYTLEEGETINVTIYMKAPTDNDVIYPSIKDNAYAYNNVYLKNDLTPKGGTTTPMFIHQDYTKISINEPTMDYEFIKKDKVTNEPIQGVTFTLSGTSFTGETYNITATSDSDGKVKFAGLKYNPDGYTITETEKEGYASLSKDYKLVIDGKYENEEYNLFAKLYDSRNSEIETVYNTPLQDITIKKYIADKDNNTYINKELATNVTFTLSGVTLSEKDVNKTYNLENGIITLTDVEPGTYLLEEETLENIKTSKWNLIVNDDKKYSIFKYGEDVDVSLPKIESETPVDEEEKENIIYNEKTYDIDLSKKVSTTDEFTFEVSLNTKNNIKVSKDIEMIKGSLSDGVISPDNGEIEFKVKLKNNEAIKISGLLYKDTYEINEKSSPYLGSYKIDNESPVTNDKSKKDLSTGSKSITKDTLVEYTNTYKAEGKLSLVASKELTGKTLDNNQFTFELYKDDELLQTKKNINDTITFDDITYNETDIGKTYTYVIKEKDESLSGYTYDTHEETIKVNIIDNKDGTLSAQIQNEHDIKFINAYNADGSLIIKLNKEYNSEDTFEFVLKDQNNNTLQTVSNNEEGIIEFSPIAYTESDIGKTYTYTVSEIKGDNKLIEYDSDVKTVTVSITDNSDGTLNISDTYSDKTFKNTLNTKVVIEKYDDKGYPLEGATLSIYKEGAEIEKWDKENKELVLPDGEYTLKELEAPVGYEKSKDIVFKVEKGKTYIYDEEISVIKVINKKKAAQIDIIKQDKAGNILKGVLLEIRDKNNKAIETIITSDKNTITLEDGSYTIKEVKALPGYKDIKDIKFNISDAQLKKYKDNRLIIENEKIEKTVQTGLSNNIANFILVIGSITFFGGLYHFTNSKRKEYE